MRPLAEETGRRARDTTTATQGKHEVASSRNRTIGFGVLALVLVALLAWQASDHGPAGDEAETGDVAGSQLPSGETAGAGTGELAPRDRRPGMSQQEKDAEAARYLQDQFGATISNKRTQIKAIEKLVNYLMREYPDDWQQRLQALLEQAFPGMGAQLYAQYQNMQAYNDWLAANRAELQQMTPDERRAALGDARFRYFGDDVAEIFEESIRQEHILDAMKEIEQAPDAPVDEKLSKYVDSIKQAYGEKAPSFIENRQTELMNNFLTLPSVQDDLHAMAPEARERQMEGVRRQMGLDDEAIDRWRELDAERDRAWASGERYMEERERIASRYEGDEQARQLQELRDRYFDAEEADVIRSEEESGFFRFDHRRVYGKE